MKIWKRLSASVMTGFVFSTEDKLPKTKPGHQTSVPSLAQTGQFIVLFGPLTPEISRKLGPHLMVAGEEETSPPNGDHRLKREALALIARAIDYLDGEDSLIEREALADYREG